MRGGILKKKPPAAVSNKCKLADFTVIAYEQQCVCVFKTRTVECMAQCWWHQLQIKDLSDLQIKNQSKKQQIEYVIRLIVYLSTIYSWLGMRYSPLPHPMSFHWLCYSLYGRIYDTSAEKINKSKKEGQKYAQKHNQCFLDLFIYCLADL